MKFTTSLIITASTLNLAQAFTKAHYIRTPKPFALYGSTKNDNSAAPVEQKQALPVGTLCEFHDTKGHTFIGQVSSATHKSNGNNRYSVTSHEGKNFDVAEKQVVFTTPGPSNQKEAARILMEMNKVHDASSTELRSVLDIDAETLHLAWEETILESDLGVNTKPMLTAKSLIDLIHSRTPASVVEAYCAWRLLGTDMGRIFFKEIKENGRVTSFKARARKAVEGAKQTFCSNHSDEAEFCLV